MIRHLSRFKSFGCPTYQLGVVRLLYSAQSLGLDAYTVTRNQMKFRLAGEETKEEFFNRVQPFLANNYTGNVYVQDIDMFLYLAEGTPEELSIVPGKKKQFLSGGADNVFGPVVMRLLHFVNNPHEAYSLLKDPNLEDTFKEFISFQIAMDLTLKNRMYWETVDIFAILQRRFVSTSSLKPQHFPESCLILCMAALYEINTPESFHLMQAYLKLAQRYSVGRMRRVLTFSAALAIRQSHPGEALHILKLTKQQSYFTIRNLHILALVQLCEFTEVLRLLRLCIDSEETIESTERKPTILSDVFEAVKEGVVISANKEQQAAFSGIEKRCWELHAIDSRTLDTALKSNIDYIGPAVKKRRENKYTIRS